MNRFLMSLQNWISLYLIQNNVFLFFQCRHILYLFDICNEHLRILQMNKNNSRLSQNKIIK